MVVLLDVLGRLGSIILIDLVLAGDNALVIGMAARSLPPVQRRRAIIWGSVAAVLLRLGFAAIVTLLLNIPLLSAVGGLLLFWIARKIVRTDNHASEVAAGTSIADAVKIIVIADVVMSLDNVLALAGVAQGHIWLLAMGLMLTVPLIVWGSTLISTLLNRLPWLIYAGVAVLLWTGVGMILNDPIVRSQLPSTIIALESWLQTLLTTAGTAALWFEARRSNQRGKDGQQSVPSVEPQS